jgi:hypothetical protein
MNYKPCCNAMETLVREEIDRQLTAPGAPQSQNFDRADAIAYALNRLPALYATTEEGWERQIQRAQKGLMDLIIMTTAWGINEAQRKYKPFDTPLAKETASPAAERALTELRILFDRDDISWNNLSQVIQDLMPSTRYSSAQHESRSSYHYYPKGIGRIPTTAPPLSVQVQA